MAKRELFLKDIMILDKSSQPLYPQSVDVADTFVLSSPAPQTPLLDLDTNEIYPPSAPLSRISFVKKRVIYLFSLSNPLRSLDLIPYSTKFVLGIFRRHHPLLPPVLSLSTHKKYTIANSIDIRFPHLLTKSAVRHPDLFVLAPTLSQQFDTFSRKGKKQTVATLRKVSRFSRKHTASVVASFSIVLSLILLIIAAKNVALAKTENAYRDLEAAAKTIVVDPAHAHAEFFRVKQEFALLGAWLSPLRLLWGNNILSIAPVNTAVSVISAGEHLSQAAAKSTELYRLFLKESKKNKAPTTQSGVLASPYATFRWTEFLIKHKDTIQDLNDAVQSANKELANVVKPPLSPEKAQKFEKAKAILAQGSAGMAFLVNHFDDTMYALGNTRPMKFVILNQNNDEIRASGGFPGTLISLELYKGAVQKWAQRDIYEYDWNLYPYKEKPPEGLSLISTNHGLRDANYYPEFVKNAAKMNFFIEKAGFDSVDTFIAINQKIVQAFLEKYGPIYFAPLNETISAQNFSLVFSTLVEAKVFLNKNSTDWKKTPKSILFSFVEEFSRALLAKKDLAGYSHLLVQSLTSHEIQVASLDGQVQDFIQNIGITDGWLSDKNNWVYPVFTSVGGNKSDRYVYRTMSLAPQPQLGCGFVNTFHLHQEHTFGDSEWNALQKLYATYKVPKEDQDHLTQIEGAGTNKSFVRVLTPKGSTLIAGDKNIVVNTDNSNSEYTIFSFLLSTEVHKSSDISFSYKTKPQECFGKVQFYLQPGLQNVVIKE